MDVGSRSSMAPVVEQSWKEPEALAQAYRQGELAPVCIAFDLFEVRFAVAFVLENWWAQAENEDSSETV